MMNLEYLSDRKVIARMNLHEVRQVKNPSGRKWYQLHSPEPTFKSERVPVVVNHQNKKHVIAYMLAWSELLAEADAMDVAAPELQEAQVS